MNDQQGFTLIELMIVVTIIGILASIALPAYQTYTKKAHVMEGINLTGAVKSSIWDYWSANGNFPANNQVAGLATTITGHAIKNISVSGNTITITFNSKVADDSTIVLSANSTQGALQWDCTAGTLEDKYRPTTCR